MYKSLNAVTVSQQASGAKKLPFVSFRWRWFKQKSVVVVLFWSFSAFLLDNYVVRRFVRNDGVIPVEVWLSLTVVGEILVFAGSWFLADVYFGRYKVLKVSMLMMFLATILWSLSLSLGWRHTHGVINDVISLMICFTCGGFQANIVQFGMDQLRDSSTIEITSFMCFYVWTFFFSELCVNLVSVCISEEYDAIVCLVFTILIGLSVSSDFLFGHWLVKEPVMQNPLKLIFQVLHYAAKNKYPSERNAYTYWDDKNSSRLDLAMRKYGGSYSTEQVEDVKRFLKILSILFTVCALMGLLFVDTVIFHISIPYNFRGLSNSTCSGTKVCPEQCFRKFIVDIGIAVIVIFTLVWELLVFPVIWKSLLRWKILKKHTIAMIVLFTYIASLVTIEGIGEHRWRSLNPSGDYTCPITHYADTPRYFEISYTWLVIPSILLNFGLFSIAQTGLQFVFAQSPYCMKGLIVNTTYLMIAVAIMGFYCAQMLLKLNVFSGLGHLGCVFWWLLASGVVVLVLVALFLLTCSRYHFRRRDDASNEDTSY